MQTKDLGLRYVSPRRWCWKADDGSWIKAPKWAAQMYLMAKLGFAATKSTKLFRSPINGAMDKVIENFHVDIAGHYDFAEEIRVAIDHFTTDLPIESTGYLKAGEYQLPDGRIMLLISDAQICLMA
jgi:hypothetical protein